MLSKVSLMRMLCIVSCETYASQSKTNMPYKQDQAKSYIQRLRLVYLFRNDSFN